MANYSASQRTWEKKKRCSFARTCKGFVRSCKSIARVWVIFAWFHWRFVRFEAMHFRVNFDTVVSVVSVWSQVIHWGQTSKFTCHLVSFAFLQCLFWWPTLIKDIKKHVSANTICAQNKSSRIPPDGLFHLLLTLGLTSWWILWLAYHRHSHNSWSFLNDQHFVPPPKHSSVLKTAQLLVDYVSHLLPLQNVPCLERILLHSWCPC